MNMTLNPAPRPGYLIPHPDPCRRAETRLQSGLSRVWVVFFRAGFGVQRFSSVAPNVAPNVAAIIQQNHRLRPLVQRCNVNMAFRPRMCAHARAHAAVCAIKHTYKRCSVALILYLSEIIDKMVQHFVQHSVQRPAKMSKALHQFSLSKPSKALKTFDNGGFNA